VSLFADEVRPFCGSDELLRETLSANPEIQKALGALDAASRQYAEAHASRRVRSLSGPNEIIPVVVYVVHAGGTERALGSCATGETAGGPGTRAAWRRVPRSASMLIDIPGGQRNSSRVDRQ